MNHDNLSLLKGNYSKCSILFSDIRNFTTLTEQFGATLNPQVFFLKKRKVL